MTQRKHLIKSNSFHDKHTQQTRNKTEFTQHENMTFMKNKINIILNGERIKAFPLRSETRERMLTFTTYIEHCTRSFSQSKRIRKSKKEKQKAS